MSIQRISYAAVAIAGCLASSAVGEVTAKHREFAQSVLQQLLPHVDSHEMWEVWPPEIRVTDPGFANAFASYEVRDEKRIPFVVVTVTEIEKVAKFNRSALAFSVGHELGHLVHDDLQASQNVRKRVGSSQLTLMAVGREQELAADLYGMQIALQAGFDREGLQSNLENTMRQSQPYCSFEGLSLSHPSWEARTAFLQKDENKRRLWQSMSAFRSGVFFLQNEQFKHAEFCFLRVTMAFPECYEAWANLGYARLMQYCDLLETEDVRRFDIGHLVVGGFYERPESLAEQTRAGIDEDLWFDAVEALREALRLKQVLRLKTDLTLVKANLAVAHLVHPSGKKDVGRAGKLFAEVFKALEDEKVAQGINPLVRAALLINAGAGRGDSQQELLTSATAALAQFEANRTGKSPGLKTVEAALKYSKAKALSASGQEADERKALKMWEEYLRLVNPACAWWPLAYEQYSRLAANLNATPIPETQLSRQKPTAWRRVTQIEVGENLPVGLAESIDDVLKRLGEPDSVERVVPGTRIMRYRYDRYGLTVLATREVLALILTGDNAPAIAIQRPGLGSEPVKLTVGMPRSKIESYLGDGWDVESASLYDRTIAHQLYRDVGIAVRYAKGNVGELVVAIVPRASSRR